LAASPPTGTAHRSTTTSRTTRPECSATLTNTTPAVLGTRRCAPWTPCLWASA